jgi:broad specificity phosphatase PhoE
MVVIWPSYRTNGYRVNREWGKQACTLRPFLSGIHFNHVLTSPLCRARRTCELAGLSEQAQIEPDLLEWNYGAYEGYLPKKICQHRPGWNIYINGCPDGETSSQITDRADGLIARIRTLRGNIALFGHAHFGCSLAARWIGLPIINGQNLFMATGTVSMLGYHPRHPDVPAILKWNILG